MSRAWSGCSVGGASGAGAARFRRRRPNISSPMIIAIPLPASHMSQDTDAAPSSLDPLLVMIAVGTFGDDDVVTGLSSVVSGRIIFSVAAIGSSNGSPFRTMSPGRKSLVVTPISATDSMVSSTMTVTGSMAATGSMATAGSMTTAASMDSATGRTGLMTARLPSKDGMDSQLPAFS